MLNNSLKIIAIWGVLLLTLSGCMNISTTPPIETPVLTTSTSNIPKYAFEKAEQDKKAFLLKNAKSASDLKYRFFYNQKGEACLEYTITPKGRYTWSKPTWIGRQWGNTSGSIGNNETKYTLTKKRADEAQARLEERRKDPVFREIEKIVLQIASEYDYDFYDAYRKPVKYRNKYVKTAVCDGYADAIQRAFINHPLVAKVEKWSGGNHAWNTIILKDGRKLYCDATWYDGNGIDDEGYVIHIPKQTPVNLTFDINEFNSLGGAINKKTGKLLAVHFAWPHVKANK